MVIVDVLNHEPFQVAFIEDDHMVEQVPTAVADPAFGNTVLPRTSEAGSLGSMPNVFTASIISALKLEPQSKIR
jgi:hypothetical protein